MLPVVRVKRIGALELGLYCLLVGDLDCGPYGFGLSVSLGRIDDGRPGPTALGALYGFRPSPTSSFLPTKLFCINEIAFF